MKLSSIGLRNGLGFFFSFRIPSDAIVPKVVLSFPLLLDFWQSLLIFCPLAARRAENLSPKGFLFALSNPFGCNCPKEKRRLLPSFFFGPPEGIRPPDLQNRNLLRYPTAPRADFGLPMKYTMFEQKSQANEVEEFGCLTVLQHGRKGCRFFSSPIRIPHKK